MTSIFKEGAVPKAYRLDQNDPKVRAKIEATRDAQAKTLANKDNYTLEELRRTVVNV